jgi:hypothetical protein
MTTTEQQIKAKLQEQMIKFMEVAHEMGLTPEKTLQLMASKQGIEMITNRVK